MTFTKIITAGAAALALAGAAHANSFTDGSFAEGAAAGAFSTYYAGSTFGAWAVTSGSVDLIGTYWPGPTSTSYSVDMNGLTAGTISQNFTLGAGEYRLSFWIAANPDGGPQTRSVLATVGDASQTFTFDATGATRSNMGWTLETMTFTTAGATTLSFASETEPSSGYSPYGASIGGVTVTSVPEPASLGLLLAGLGLFGVMASRRRAR